MSSESEKITILAVDDTPANIDVVKGVLGREYMVQAAVNGAMALKIVARKKPDLILLDIMMPEMDGYEVCRRLKADAETRDIPIIFLTAKAEEEDETKGLALGAVDYITKPISPAILLARVDAHLRLKEAADVLRRENELIAENARLRDDVERITRHDLKGPLSAIINYPQFIRRDGDVSEKQEGHLKRIESAGRKILNMINLSLGLYKMEQGTYELEAQDVDLASLVGEIIGDAKTRLLSKRLEVVVENERAMGDECSFIVRGDGMLLYSMLSNIIGNAIDASPKKAQIRIQLATDADAIIRVHNQGAIPQDIRPSFFDKYVTAGKSSGTGLGTYSAKLIAEAHAGAISFESSEDEGTTIQVTLPQGAAG